MILKNEEITPLALIGLIGAYGPTIAAIIVQAVLDKQKLRSLFGSLIKLRTKAFNYIFIIVFPILVYGTSYVISAVIFD